MKINICIVCSFILVSCSTSKIENQVVHDFIKEQLLIRPNCRYVEKQPVKRLLPLEFYEKAFEDRNIRLGDMARVIPNSYPPFKWPVDSIEIQKLKEKYEKENTKQLWKKEDFHGLNLKLVNSKKIEKSGNSISDKLYGSETLAVSKPIITTDKKYAFLFFRIFNFGISFGHTTDKPILMKNLNGKWKTIETYYDPNIIN